MRILSWSIFSKPHPHTAKQEQRRTDAHHTSGWIFAHSIRRVEQIFHRQEDLAGRGKWERHRPPHIQVHDNKTVERIAVAIILELIAGKKGPLPRR
jgi:hypothetical protein